MRFILIFARLLQAPVPRLNRAIAEEQLGVEAAARGDAAAAERLYSAAVEVRGTERAAPRAASLLHCSFVQGAVSRTGHDAGT